MAQAGTITRDTQLRPLKAKFPTSCAHCGGKIGKGDRIMWAPGFVSHPSHYNSVSS